MRSETLNIVEIKRTTMPNYGMAADGYTTKSGAPTSYKIRLEKEKIWRRLMVWQFSNVGTLFVKIKGKNVIVPEYSLPIC